MKKAARFAISIYQKLFSPFLGNNCRFFPSCSQYAAEAIEKKGVMLGLALSLWRLLRCQPLSKGGFDPVE